MGLYYKGKQWQSYGWRTIMESNCGWAESLRRSTSLNGGFRLKKNMRESSLMIMGSYASLSLHFVWWRMQQGKTYTRAYITQSLGSAWCSVLLAWTTARDVHVLFVLPKFWCCDWSELVAGLVWCNKRQSKLGPEECVVSLLCLLCFGI